MRSDPTQRFSDRVEAYVKYRPSYPSATIDALEQASRIQKSATIADIGSGTGILTQLLLDRGHEVHAVEPNAPMRAAAEQTLGAYANFHSHNGAAESTGLPDASVDLIVAAQAFHWFDREKTAREFRRILKPQGAIALIWNRLLTDASPFLTDYDAFLVANANDYPSTDHPKATDDEIRAFFAPAAMKTLSFPNRQQFDYPGLAGRCLSSSYAPAEGHPEHAPFFEKLATLFAKHQRGGRVAFEYRTSLYLATID